MKTPRQPKDKILKEGEPWQACVSEKGDEKAPASPEEVASLRDETNEPPDEGEDLPLKEQK